MPPVAPYGLQSFERNVRKVPKLSQCEETSVLLVLSESKRQAAKWPQHWDGKLFGGDHEDRLTRALTSSPAPREAMA